MVSRGRKLFGSTNCILLSFSVSSTILGISRRWSPRCNWPRDLGTVAGNGRSQRWVERMSGSNAECHCGLPSPTQPSLQRWLSLRGMPGRGPGLSRGKVATGTPIMALMVLSGAVSWSQTDANCNWWAGKCSREQAHGATLANEEGALPWPEVHGGSP